MKRLRLLRLPQGNAGFTIVEILAALVLFSIICFPLAGLLVSESRLQGTYQAKCYAVEIARSEMEKVKGCRRPLENRSYQVEMAGRRWDVERRVEKDSGMLVMDAQIVEPQFITITVSRETDTLDLADFRIMQEVYR